MTRGPTHTILISNTSSDEDLDTMTQTETVGRALLLEILGWSRPHESECEKRFCREYLDKVPGMQQDAFGNRFLKIGNTRAAWSCHVDTVARRGGPQAIQVDFATGTISLKDGKKKCSLGADDGTGIWMMLEMIRHERPGLYIFHRGEEHGCLGSSYIRQHTPELLNGIDFIMAFDRAGFQDVITHQASGKTASDAFAQSFADQLNEVYPFDYRPDDTGVYTDTNEYADLVPECSNLSVGYRGQHTHKETQNLYHAEALLEAVLVLDVSKLTIEREPGDSGYGYGAVQWGRGTNSFGFSSRYQEPTELDEMADIIGDYPHEVAAILQAQGMSAWGLWEAVLDQQDAERLERAFREAEHEAELVERDTDLAGGWHLEDGDPYPTWRTTSAAA